MLGQQQQQRPEVPAPLHPQAMLQQQQQPMPEPTAQTGSVQLAGATTAHPSSAATAQTQALPTQQAASQVAPLAAPAAVTSAVPVITSGINAAAGQPPQLPAATAASPSGVRPATSVSASDPRLQKVGFAKLLGDGVEYYIRKYEIVLGRKSKVGRS